MATININGNPVQFSGSQISYEQVLELANLPSESGSYTIKVFGDTGMPLGDLTVGNSVAVQDGMSFDIQQS